MDNPTCICLDVLVDAACGKVDRATWIVEHAHYVRDGHVASCHHHSTFPKAHRGLARILDDLLNGEELVA